MRARTLALAAALVLAGCTTATDAPAGPATATRGSASSPADGDSLPFQVREVASYDQPWAMAFLPGTPYAAITERGGALFVRDLESDRQVEVDGVPVVQVAGQGGLGDIIVAPSFEQDQRVYLSWVEPGDAGTSGAAVGLGRLVVDESGARLENLNVIWRQVPKVGGDGHFAHRLAISPDERYLFVTSGERQQEEPAQDRSTNLGKILRLNVDGTPAAGNPFSDEPYPATEIWSLGHRNPLGLAFDRSGQLWNSEMGPQGGDELNLVVAGANYGWPRVSNGSAYSGADIPDHAAGDGFEAPTVWWTPSVSPGSLMIYTGSAFPEWRGDAFVGALSGQSLIRVDLDGASATVAERFAGGDLGARLRALAQGPDGSIWVLQDGSGGKLLQLTPGT